MRRLLPSDQRHCECVSRCILSSCLKSWFLSLSSRSLSSLLLELSLSPGHSPCVSSAPSAETTAEPSFLLSDEPKSVTCLSSGPVVSCRNTPVVAPCACHVLTTIGQSLCTGSSCSATCYGRSCQSPGYSIAPHSPNSCRLALALSTVLGALRPSGTGSGIGAAAGLGETDPDRPCSAGA